MDDPRFSQINGGKQYDLKSDFLNGHKSQEQREEICAQLVWKNNVGQWVGQWVSQWVSEWVSEWVSGWVSEWVSEWVWKNNVVNVNGIDGQVSASFFVILVSICCTCSSFILIVDNDSWLIVEDMIPRISFKIQVYS